jgi:GntR family transcriptional regulator
VAEEEKIRREAASAAPGALGYRPLYRQAKEILLKRLAEGVWQPGQALPSEPELASDLGVSPGTVRKALDEMTAENLLVRRQGRGTFVARHDEARILFQFFKLVSDAGERRFPESRLLRLEAAKADAAAAGRLRIPQGAPVAAIERVRLLEDCPRVHEWIVVPGSLFPGLASRADLPNNLYELYASAYGVTIARATERLKAVAAGPRQAELLETERGHPLLAIDRLAFAVDGTPAEWRLSLCRTDAFHYASELR